MQAAQTAQITSLPYTRRESFARYVLSTNAPEIEVVAVQDTLSTPGGFNSVGVIVDGVNQGSGLQLGAVLGVASSQVFQLPGGTRTVELVDGPCYARGNGASYNVGGTPILRYRIPPGFSCSVVAPSAPAKRLLIVGDSIMVGAIVTSGSGVYQAVGALIRKNALASGAGAFAGARVIVAGVAGGRLHDFTVSGGTVTATVAEWSAQLDGSSANGLVFTLGTNDYAAGMAVASFQAELETLLDAFHTARPTVSVFLYAPISRVSPSGEGANAGGSTMAQFRTALQTVATARASYCTYRSGAGVVSGGNYSPDGVHHNGAGAIEQEADMRIQIGY